MTDRWEQADKLSRKIKLPEEFTAGMWATIRKAQADAWQEGYDLGHRYGLEDARAVGTVWEHSMVQARNPYRDGGS